MQLSNFLVIFALNLHNFCQCLPANSDKITDRSIENEEIKEKSLENVISETVLWEHERNHTAGLDYFYGDEHEHKDNKTHGSHETHGSFEAHGHDHQEENGSQQTKGSDKTPKPQESQESHGSHETHGSFEAHGHKHDEANEAPGTIATPLDLEYESHETSGNYINVCGVSSSQAVIFKLQIFEIFFLYFKMIVYSTGDSQ